jgi:hypothetical protein
MGAYGMAPSDGQVKEPEWLVRDLIASMFAFKFEPKRPTSTIYARVWKCTGTVSDFRRATEEPEGIISHEHPIGKSKWTRDDLYWVKVDSEWLSTNSDDLVFARGDQITEAEFGTDIAFGLFKRLKVTRRPLRTWYKRNRPLIRKWNIFGAAFSVMMLSYCTGKVTRDEFDVWAAVGIFFAVWSVSSIVWMCKSITPTK